MYVLGFLGVMLEMETRWSHQAGRYAGNVTNKLRWERKKYGSISKNHMPILLAITKYFLML